jgi:hypothetical protein
MMNKGVIRALVVLVVFGITGVANALPITQTYEFTATGFASSAPVDPVTGSVTVTFDPMGVDVFDQVTGITVNSLNLQLSSAPAFSYFTYTGNYYSATKLLIVGGIYSGASGVASNTNDFYVVIGNPGSSSPSMERLFYNQRVLYGTSSGGSQTGSVSITSVPEPSTIATLSVGLLGVGFAMMELLSKVGDGGFRRRVRLAFLRP